MTIQFKTDAVYTLDSLKLLCTYIEDNTIWLKSDSYPISDTTLLYKLDRKSKKLSSCDEYQPASWSVSSEQEEQLAFDECASLERLAMSVKGYKESDCYYVE